MFPFIAPFLMLLPEMVLFSTGLLAILWGIFSEEEKAFRQVFLIVMGGMALSLAILLRLHLQAEAQSLSFGDEFLLDSFAFYMKLLIMGGAFVLLALARCCRVEHGLDSFEFPILFLFSLLGMMIMVSANHLLVLYMGLELQSLSLYLMASFRRRHLLSCEAGLKYFLLGALSSVILLYGCSLVYGFSGALDFPTISYWIAGADISPGFIIGLVFIIAGLAFKISAAPFHMWTPDVYEGAPTPVTALFSTLAKLAAFGLFVRLLLGPFADLMGDWRSIVSILALASMLVGAFGAMAQTNIKRFMAYSSINHVGYALIALASGGMAGGQAVLIYLAIYMVTNLGVFSFILMMSRGNAPTENISALSGLSRNDPVMAFILLILMFSLAGLPPFAGFFAKYYVFIVALRAELYALAIFGAVMSVVSAFYYLRIVKLVYFDPPATAFNKAALPLRLTSLASGALLCFFLLHPSLLTSFALDAASPLFR